MPARTWTYRSWQRFNRPQRGCWPSVWAPIGETSVAFARVSETGFPIEELHGRFRLQFDQVSVCGEKCRDFSNGARKTETASYVIVNIFTFSLSFTVRRRRRKMDAIVKKQAVNPKIEANFLSMVFFWWLHPFLRLGYSKDLSVEDLYSVIPEDTSENLGLKLQEEWKMELRRVQSSKRGSASKPSLGRALYRAFGFKYIILGFFAFFEECILRIGQPLCLSQLVNYFEPGNSMPTWQAYLYATGVVMGSALYVLNHHPYFFEVQHIGMKLRVASCSLVYRKCLQLSQKALGQTTIGQMVNLMSNDVNRFDFSVIFLHYLWVGPVQTLITMAILLFVIGPSCLVGLAVLMLFVPLQSWMGKIFSRLRLKTAKKTDERIRSMNEIVSGMRVIKMYTWEKPFAQLIELCRKKEVAVIRRTAYFRALFMSLFFTSSKLILFLTFLAYVLSGNLLTAEKVFLTVALFNSIRLIMTLFFPGAITQAAETRVSLRRIEDFLLLDEVADRSASDIRPKLKDCGITFDGVSVKWPAAEEQEDNTLTDVSFTVQPGQILAVVGHVGAGKSSLLNVILGELTARTGNVRVTGKMAYASQEPWIFSGTVRQNILCGREYDVKRYRKVVKVCALEKDFSLLPLADKTAVGERGVSLSGGQKARVNLARALYVDADIYLLDDPLSAVDTHVGRHLFDQSIVSFLGSKIRVLVTHQLQYLKDVHKIIVLKEGRVEAVGTYQELMTSGIDLERTLAEEDEENEKPLNQSFSDGDMETSLNRTESISNGSCRRRLGSTASRTSVASVAEGKTAFEEESRSSGAVSRGMYWQYFRAGGGALSFVVLVFNCLVAQILFTGTDYWLTVWTNAEELRARQMASLVNTTDNSTEQGYLFPNESVQTNTSTETSWVENIDTVTGVYVYTILIVGMFIFSLIRTGHFFIMCMKSSISLHNKMFEAVIRSPVLFFDKNPVGRVLNRFTKDIGCMDELLPTAIFDVIIIFLTNIGILYLVGWVNVWLLLPIIVLMLIFYYFRRYYMESARDVKRLEATTRSPVFTHLSSSLTGLTTLRAHRAETIFQSIFDSAQDVHSSAWYMFLATTRWFGLWLDWICVIYVACVAYACVPLRDAVSPSAAGLAISSALLLTGSFQWGVRQSAEVENQMTSVERVMEYSKLPPEAALESRPGKEPPKTWPNFGKIVFDQLFLRYQENEPPVLKNISCVIESKQKIGVVGRTGAGKSSLITSLFRMTEPEGHIYIDGIDTKSIGLHDLRSKISIIPQDPVLFSGTLRKNLDPFDEYTDEMLWSALESVKLKEVIKDLPSGLDSTMAEGGSNFSVGQRQLICLARAILRQNRVLVMDEATANVDPATDALIQMTIREKFKDCTVLTVAHRLNTIMDSDRLMVMDGGYLQEFDEPAVLLENPKTIFYGMVEQTGRLNADLLIDLARQAAQKRLTIPTDSEKSVSKNHLATPKEPNKLDDVEFSEKL